MKNMSRKSFGKGIVGILLHSDLEEFHNIKSFLFYVLKMVLCISGIIYCASLYKLLDNVSVAFYFSAIALGTFIYAFVFILSTFFYNKKSVLFAILPIKRNYLFIYIWIDILVEIFVTKFVPLLIGVSGYFTYLGKMCVYDSIYQIIEGVFVFVSFASLSFMLALYIGARKLVRAGVVLGVVLALFYDVAFFEPNFIAYIGVAILLLVLCYYIYLKYYNEVIVVKKRQRGISGGMLQREFKMFFGNKILVANFAISVGLSLFLAVNLILTKESNNFMASIMLLLPVFSNTTFVLYSYEGERIKLIKSLPFKLSSLFAQMYVLSVSITLLSVIILTAILYIGGVVGGKFILLYIFSALFICAEKILLDMAMPLVDYSHTEELLRNSRKYKMYLMGFAGYCPMLLLDTAIPVGFLCGLSVAINCWIIGVLLKKNLLK